MTDLGIKSSESPYPVTAAPSREVYYPTIDVCGEQAKLMGVQKLKEGVEYDVTICVRLKRLTLTKRDGVPDEVSGCLEIVSMGDYSVDDETDDDSSSGIGASVAKAVARGGARAY